jgi:DEAD/DEAH box helicase domain-containing protein
VPSADPGAPASSTPSPPAAAAGTAATAAAAVAANAAGELQAQIEAALPPRGSFKERFGAAGTTIDQRRESPIVEMSLLLSEAVMHGLRTIAFCKSRKLCELVAAYCRENLRAAAPHKAHMVKVGGAGEGGHVGAVRTGTAAVLHGGPCC